MDRNQQFERRGEKKFLTYANGLGAPWVRKFGNPSMSEISVRLDVTSVRPTDRTSVRSTQGNQ